jgi:hypothetical protein
LAFHPYPQLIPSVFNLSGFGPPRGLTRASPWPWVDHSASGPEHTTTPPQGGYALFRLAFAAATPHGLTITPQQKSKALTACRHTVSGTISLPSRGTFHHSLTVLIRYRSSGSIQAYRVVPADSQQIPRARCYSGNNTKQACSFHLPGSHRLRQTIPGHFD